MDKYITSDKNYSKCEHEIDLLRFNFDILQQTGNVFLWEKKEDSEEIYLSKAFVKYFELEDAKEYTVNDINEFIHPDFIDLHIKSIENCNKNNKEISIDLKVVDLAGNEIWFNEKIVYKKFKDNNVIIGIFQNIDEIVKHKEQILMEKEKAEKAEQVQKEFVQNFSHEIRTPITAINGFCEILLDYDLPEDQRIILDLIKNSGKGLAIIINNIIDVSLLETGKLELIKRDFDIYLLLNEMKKVFASDLMSSTFEINIIPGESGRDIIYTDGLKLKSILFNLISNSIKFTKKGEVKVWFEKGENNYTFYIKDTGIGIKKENLDIIFHAFRQEDGSETRAYNGLGVGLYITKHLIDFLGGELKIETEEGKGSLFYFTLPNNKNDII